jgi:hypothetical protein
MIRITVANSTIRSNHFSYYRLRDMAWTPGRLGRFPDVMDSKRPNFFSCKFIDALGRPGRSGRLCRDDEYARINYMCFTCIWGRHRKNVRNVRNVREEFNLHSLLHSEIERYPGYESLI